MNQLKDFKLVEFQRASDSGEMHKSQYFSIAAITGKQIRKKIHLHYSPIPLTNYEAMKKRDVYVSYEENYKNQGKI